MKVTRCEFVHNLPCEQVSNRLTELEAENAKLREERDMYRDLVGMMDHPDLNAQLNAENAKLREQLERVQPTDCEGNVLDIADTVHMLRSEYDGDHEWEDVVTELVLTKWGGDRWIVRGSKGEAWACDCTKTGYYEDAYEGSDDVEPFDEPTLLEVENAKLREQTELLVTLLRNDCDIEASWDGLRKFWYIGLTESGCLMRDRACKAEAENAKLRELFNETLARLVAANEAAGGGFMDARYCELLESHGIEVDG